MKLSGHIDHDLFDIFMRERVYEKYAIKYMAADQVDDVDVSKIPGYTI